MALQQVAKLLTVTITQDAVKTTLHKQYVFLEL